MNEPGNCGEIIAVLYELTKRTQEKLFQLSKIIQHICCAQSGASIRLTVWKCSGEHKHPGALPLFPALENEILKFHDKISQVFHDQYEPWKKGALFSLIYFFESSSIHCIFCIIMSFSEQCHMPFCKFILPFTLPVFVYGWNMSVCLDMARKGSYTCIFKKFYLPKGFLLWKKKIIKSSNLFQFGFTGSKYYPHLFPDNFERGSCFADIALVCLYR